MEGVQVASTDALEALGAAFGRSGEEIAEGLDAARNMVSRAMNEMEERTIRCRGQIAYWNERISGADEDEDTSGYEREIEEWEERLATVRQRQANIEEAQAAFSTHARRLQELAGEGAPKARAFLNRRLDEIESYASYRPDEGGGGSGLGGIGGGEQAKPLEPEFQSGYRRGRKDPRDWLWSRLFGKVAESLPARASTESLFGIAGDQGETPQCVAYSLAALEHHDVLRDRGDWVQFDPQTIYAVCKARDGSPREDGTTIRDAMKAGAKAGLVDDQGRMHRIEGYVRMESADEIRHALSLGKAVMLGVQISSKGLSRVSRDAVADVPEETDGGHCMVAVGYDDELRALRIRNSWGRSWADNGHCWMPYLYLLTDPDFEAWTTCEGDPESVALPKEASAARPSREVSTTNFAWFDPSDVTLAGEDGPGLEWTGIPREVAEAGLARLGEFRDEIALAELKGDFKNTVRDRLAQKGLDEEGLRFFDLFFGSDAIRIAGDGRGGYMVVNGRHRLWLAQQLGIASVPISIDNAARRSLGERIARGEG